MWFHRRAAYIQPHSPRSQGTLQKRGRKIAGAREVTQDQMELKPTSSWDPVRMNLQHCYPRAQDLFELNWFVLFQISLSNCPLTISSHKDKIPQIINWQIGTELTQFANIYLSMHTKGTLSVLSIHPHYCPHPNTFTLRAVDMPAPSAFSHYQHASGPVSVCRTTPQILSHIIKTTLKCLLKSLTS